MAEGASPDRNIQRHARSPNHRTCVEPPASVAPTMPVLLLAVPGEQPEQAAEADRIVDDAASQSPVTRLKKRRQSSGKALAWPAR